jgi:hypothetical protein
VSSGRHFRYGIIENGNSSFIKVTSAMIITLQISPETEQLLQEKASRHGQSLEAYLQVIAEREAHRHENICKSIDTTSADPWVARWRAWAQNHSVSATTADDSRESLYAGRGE